MASHFKQPDEKNGASDARRGPGAPQAGRHAAGQDARTQRAARAGGNPRTHLRTHHGGDESYHAPAGNPHAASTPHSTSARYIPVVGAPEQASGRRGRRSRRDGFVETDPYDLTGRRSKDPKKRAGRVISVVLFVVGIALIATAAGMWIYNQWQYHEQDVLNEELATYADVSDNGTTAPSVDWEGLKAVNDDVVGWVQIPGTVVNFPVYQAEDNEKYIRTGADGSYAVGGLIFMDYANTAPGMVDGQTLIYGHHMRNGTMFKVVSDMVNQEMFDSVSTVWYVTEDATYDLEPLFIYQTDGDDENARKFTFESDEELHSYLTDLLGKAVAKNPDAQKLIDQASNVLTLCTCNYDYGDNGRTLLVCVPKPAAETDSATGDAA